MAQNRITRRWRIRRSIRSKIQGVPEIPRLSVFKSNKYIYAQLIDDTTGTTLAQSSSQSKDSLNCEVAFQVGQDLAAKVQKTITKVVFDRGGWKYHGQVRALAEGARKGGLSF